MRKQRGWAALLPVGLIAIAATGGVIVATEQISGTEKPMLSNALTGQTQLREGNVSVEFLGGNPVQPGSPLQAPSK